MPETAGTPFGALLRRLRLDAKLSQEALAERARLSAESISALERGARRAPYRSTVDLLADGLALSASQRDVLINAAARGRAPRSSAIAGDARIPTYVTSFFDRERERADLALLLERARIVTLCGPGGVGKTRLAVEAVKKAPAVAGGVRFVDLASLRDGNDIVAKIATALDAGISAASSLQALAAALAASALLVIVDNCEHVIDACALAIEALARDCPHMRFLATSREPLLIDGETLYRVAPFADAEPAIALFLERVQAAAPANGPNADRVLVEEIAARLDGMPLAIELAAGLARTQSVAQIAQTLTTADFLSIATRRTAIEHQRTMEATLAWSYALLSEREREVLRVLAYPLAGTAKAAISDVAGPAGAAVVARLIMTSLAIDEPLSGRVRLHEMTRQYVVSQTPQDERNTIAQRYADWLAGRMQAAFMTGWRTSSYSIYEPLAAEIDNVRQALRWTLTRHDRETARNLCAAPDYWTAVGRPPEGYDWLQRIDTELTIDGSDPRDATLLFGIALCAAQSGYAQRARGPGRRAAEAARKYGVTLIEARCAIALGNSLLVDGDARAAAESLAAATALFESTNDTTGRARAQSFHALASIELGEYDRAAYLLAGAVELHADMAEPVGATDELVVEMLLGDLARLRGDLPTGLERAREAAALLGDGHRTWIHVRAMHQLIDALVDAGDFSEAAAVALPELIRLHERGFGTDVALLIERLAIAWSRCGEYQLAARAAGFTEHTLAAAGRRRMRFDRIVRLTLTSELAAIASPAELLGLQRAGSLEPPTAFIGAVVGSANGTIINAA